MNNLCDASLNAASPFPTTLSGEIRRLDAPHLIDAVYNLHLKIRAEIPDDRQHYLMPKSRSYFADLLAKKTGVLLGIVVQENLVGLAAIVTCPDLDTAIKTGVITCPNVPSSLRLLCGTSPIGAVQSVSLLHDYKNQGLCRKLLEALTPEAKKNGCTHLFAQVAEQNLTSIGKFNMRGFEVASQWQKEGEHKRVLLHKAVGF